VGGKNGAIVPSEYTRDGGLVKGNGEIGRSGSGAWEGSGRWETETGRGRPFGASTLRAAAEWAQAWGKPARHLAVPTLSSLSSPLLIAVLPLRTLHGTPFAQLQETSVTCNFGGRCCVQSLWNLYFS